MLAKKIVQTAIVTLVTIIGVSDHWPACYLHVAYPSLSSLSTSSVYIAESYGISSPFVAGLFFRCSVLLAELLKQ